MNAEEMRIFGSLMRAFYEAEYAAAEAEGRKHRLISPESAIKMCIAYTLRTATTAVSDRTATTAASDRTATKQVGEPEAVVVEAAAAEVAE